MKNSEEIRRYVETCQEEFWQRVFSQETAYLAAHLAGAKDILSVGCGPAIIEGELLKLGFAVTGWMCRQRRSPARRMVYAVLPDGLRRCLLPTQRLTE